MQGVAARQAATDTARQAVVAAVQELSYDLLFSRQIKEILDESHENYRKALETAEERLQAQTENVTQVARDALKRQLGLPSELAFELADTH